MNFPISPGYVHNRDKYSSKCILGGEIKKIHVILAELYDTCPDKLAYCK